MYVVNRKSSIIHLITEKYVPNPWALVILPTDTLFIGKEVVHFMTISLNYI